MANPQSFPDGQTREGSQRAVVMSGSVHLVGFCRRWGLPSSDFEAFFSFLFIIFLPRSKRLLISWLQSPSAVILEPRKIKSLTVSIVSPSTCHEVMGLDAM